MEIDPIMLEADTPGQALTLRALRFRGTGLGPVVYMQAAIHAHEMPGTVALDRLVPRLEAAERTGRLRGDVTLVPHANPIGLTQALYGETLGRFDFNERINFNRSFPAEPAEALAGRPASEQLKATLLSLATQADVVLDLHCDDEGPVYLYVLERKLDQGHQLARALQASVILTSDGADPYSFNLSVATRWAAEGRQNDRRFSATVELRGLADVTPELADRDAQGLYRYLVDIGAVEDQLPEAPPVAPVVGDSDDAELIPTPVPGALLLEVEVGDWVRQGQRLAVIVTEAGTSRHDLLSPHDGLVVTRRELRFLRRGDYAVKVLRHPIPEGAA